MTRLEDFTNALMDRTRVQIPRCRVEHWANSFIFCCSTLLMIELEMVFHGLDTALQLDVVLNLRLMGQCHKHISTGCLLQITHYK